VTSENGLKAIFKAQGVGTRYIQWAAVYASALSKVFGIGNAPCVRSMKFFKDEIKHEGPSIFDHDAYTNIEEQSKRQFVVGSIAAFIPDIHENPFPSTFSTKMFGTSVDAMKLANCKDGGISQWAVVMSDISNTLVLDALMGNSDRKYQMTKNGPSVKNHIMGASRLEFL
jgi:hypothetical protein